MDRPRTNRRELCLHFPSLAAALPLLAVLAVAGSAWAAPVPNWQHLSTAAGEIPKSRLVGTEQTACVVLDVDRDGRNDFVIAERTSAPSVVWFRRGQSGWTEYLIDNTALPIEAGGTFADIDGDSDLDIVFGGDYRSNQLWWWENPYPAYDPAVPWVRRLVKSSGAAKHHDQLFGDFDGDGRQELVTWNQLARQLLIAEIPADPKNGAAWSFTPIYSHSSGEMEGLAAADINGDGKQDIIAGGMWLQHASGATYTPNVIDSYMGFSRAAVGQLIPGGRPEILFAYGDNDGPLKIYQWTGSAWSATTLLNPLYHGHSLQIGDVNGDGWQDIFVAEMHSPGPGAACKARVLYGDGQGNFSEQLISTGICNHESRLADLDGDGDLDILTKPFMADAPRVDVWLNGASQPVTLDDWTYIPVDAVRAKWGDFNSPPELRYFGLAWGDVDRDGMVDILSGRYFYRNPGGDMDGPWPRVDFGLNVDAMLAVDVDGDSLADVIGQAGTTMYWLEADNLQGTSWTARAIDTNALIDAHLNAQGYAAAQILPGGRQELLISNGAQVVMYTIPADPLSLPWPRTRLFGGTNSEDIAAADIDRDGRLDVASLANGAVNGTVLWGRNNGTASGWTTCVIGRTDGAEPDRIGAADLNADGRCDVVVTEEGNTLQPSCKTYWFEAPADPVNGTWVRHVVTTQCTTNSLDLGDMDRDGDIDIVVGEHRSSTNSEKLAIWANDGSGQFTERLVDTGKESHLGARVADLDGDGDMEIMSIAWDEYNFLHLWRNGATVEVTEPATNVEAVHVFYNQCAHDGNDVAANAADDAAIATDKTPLLPGRPSSFANVVTYAKGINGLMLDIRDLPGTPTVDDIRVEYSGVSDGSRLGHYSLGEDPAEITVRPGVGVNGSDRVTLIFPNFQSTGYNKNSRWMRVTVQAGANTGLSEDYVFYFGLAIGDTGDRSTRYEVNPADQLRCRMRPCGIFNPAAVDSVYDINRDRHVNAIDRLVQRAHYTNATTDLQVITAP